MKTYYVLYMNAEGTNVYVTGAVSAECALKTFRLNRSRFFTVLAVEPLPSFKRAAKKFGNI